MLSMHTLKNKTNQNQNEKKKEINLWYFLRYWTGGFIENNNKKNKNWVRRDLSNDKFTHKRIIIIQLPFDLSFSHGHNFSYFSNI